MLPSQLGNLLELAAVAAVAARPDLPMTEFSLFSSRRAVNGAGQPCHCQASESTDVYRMIGVSSYSSS